MKLLHRIKHWL